MSAFRKIGFMICILSVALCSCSSSKHASKKRRRQAPCDCPTFNYAPQPDNVYKTCTFAAAGTANATSVTNA